MSKLELRMLLESMVPRRGIFCRKCDMKSTYSELCIATVTLQQAISLHRGIVIPRSLALCTPCLMI